MVASSHGDTGPVKSAPARETAQQVRAQAQTDGFHVPLSLSRGRQTVPLGIREVGEVKLISDD